MEQAEALNVISPPHVADRGRRTLLSSARTLGGGTTGLIVRVALAFTASFVITLVLLRLLRR